MSATQAPAPSEEPLTCRAADIEQRFPALHLTRSSRTARRLGRVLLVFLGIAVLAAFFAPWQQSIRGEGWVVAFDPYERPQVVKAQVKGRVAERGEGVFENAYVEKGQLLFRIEDQDPDYLGRLQIQVNNVANEVKLAEQRLETARTLVDNNDRIVEFAGEEFEFITQSQQDYIESYNRQIRQAENKVQEAESKLLSAKAKEVQARLDYERKQRLFDREISLVPELKLQETEQKARTAAAEVGVAEQQLNNARNGVVVKTKERDGKAAELSGKLKKISQEIEKANAMANKARNDINKISEEIAQKNTKLQDMERKLTIQQLQQVEAPLSGYIMDLKVVDGLPVKQGDQLCRIVPKTDNPAVQVWVAGNDAPLIHVDDHVRLQFEGWPAVQFSGWPSVAIGTFGGKVALVDPTDNGKGKFRVLITPDKYDEDDADWPEYPYLRQGVRANGWVLLDQVPLGYEVWRRMNGFPPALQDKGSEDAGKTPKPPKIKI